MKKVFLAAGLAILCAACGSSQSAVAPSAVAGGNSAAKGDKYDLQVVLVADNDGDGVISHGDQISYSFDAKDGDWNQLATGCKQGEAVVGSALQLPSFFAPITLDSRSWSEGSAVCVGELQRFLGGMKTIASIEFTVAE